ncbi:hypothetical protein FBUS_11204 [Fasciolopsis buskii]|uniref:G-protein coupled receptors family 1 profile domain-containing protein n=1 Tax=Fasciolopsis buskii TaxID=27845 RepID=A0A8E0RQH9_9TREM|nr:hypothetical protein FBUS_11204 [Fasciolopsis buski]
MNTSAVCDKYVVERKLVGSVGIFNVVLGVIGSLIWIVYLNTPAQQAKLKSDRAQLPDVQRQPRKQSAVREESQWPSCPFRPSTRLLMMAMICTDLLGLLTSNLRFTVLSLTGTDIRLCRGDVICRLQILLAYLAGDLSIWFQVIFCMERFLIILLPTWSYSRDRGRIVPAIVLIVVAVVATLGANAFILIPNQPVCAPHFHNLVVTWFKMVYTFLIPLPLLFVSTNGVLVLLIARVGHSKLALWLGRLFGIRDQQSSDLLSEAVFASQMMVINGMVTMATSTAILLNVVIHANYCCLLTAHQNCTVDDLRFNLISLCFYTAVCIRSYILMLSSKRVRGDVKQLITQLLTCSGFCSKLRARA